MFVTTDDGIRLHVIAGTGDGVPLVLSNSLGTDTGLWNAQADALGPSRSLWRYDTRGHGRSGAPVAEILTRSPR